MRSPNLCGLSTSNFKWWRREVEVPLYSVFDSRWVMDPELKRENEKWNFSTSTREESCKKESRRCGSDSHHVFNPWRTFVLTAVNGTYYTKTFLDNLRLAVLRKRPQLVLQGVILLQENATPHLQRDVQAFLAGMGLENPRPCFRLSRPCTLRLFFPPRQEANEEMRIWIRGYNRHYCQEAYVSCA